jgi:hypothetical protein
VSNITARTPDLSGTIPTELGQLSRLITLNFCKIELCLSLLLHFGNHLNHIVLRITVTNTNLEGTIPTELGLLSNLTELSFRKIKFVLATSVLRRWVP